MAYGLCDVPQCEEQTYMGWRPKTEKIGRQVCEKHWNAHKAGTFDLYDAFGFKRPPTMTKTVKLKDYCTCGRELEPKHKFCRTCITERKRQQKRESYYRKKSQPPFDNSQAENKSLICKNEDCENEREPSHRYCSKCADRRSRKSNRERQCRHYKKITISEMA